MMRLASDLPAAYNGRILRHRPKRSERRLIYEEFYQGQPASPNMEGLPKALRKTMLGALTVSGTNRDEIVPLSI